MEIMQRNNEEIKIITNIKIVNFVFNGMLIWFININIYVRKGK